MSNRAGLDAAEKPTVNFSTADQDGPASHPARPLTIGAIFRLWQASVLARAKAQAAPAGTGEALAIQPMGTLVTSSQRGA